MSTRRITTVTTIGDQLETLAIYTDDEIKKADVYTLRSILRNIGVRYVERDGEQVPMHLCRKGEALEAVLKLAQRQRDIGKAIIPAEVNTGSIVDLPSATEVYTELVRISSLTGAPATIAMSTLAHKVVQAQALAYPDTQEQQRFNTRCKVRALLFRDVREQIATNGDDEWMLRTLVDFRTKVNTFASADSKLKREAGDAKVEAKATGTGTPIYLEPLLSFARHRLATISDTTPATEWKNIAIALALVTGRRCNELMCDITTYDADAMGWLSAYNLSKGKDGDMPNLNEITTLAPIADVMNGIQWIRDNRCIAGEEYPTAQKAREAANSRYAKDLGKQLKTLVGELHVLEDPSKLSFHGLRKLYIMECLSLLVGERTRMEETARLLGHKDWRGASINYIFDFAVVDVPQTPASQPQPTTHARTVECGL